MALPKSGNISVSQINKELRGAKNRKFDMNNTLERRLAEKPTMYSTIKFSDFRGKFLFTTANEIKRYPSDTTTWRRGNGNWIIDKTFTLTHIRHIKLSLTISSQPEGSHHGHNRNVSWAYTYINMYSEVTGRILDSVTVKHYSCIGGDNKVNISNKLLFEKSYTEAVRATIRIKMDIGNYDAHMDGERHNSSVIRYISIPYVMS